MTDSQTRDEQARVDRISEDGQQREAVSSPDGLRSGYAKITASAADGTYTVTEQWRTAADADANATDPPGLVTVAARDFKGLPGGKVDSLVPFWQDRKIDGTIETLIDASGADGSDPVEIIKVNKRYNVTADGTVVLDARDWRLREIWHSVATSIGEPETGDQRESEWDDDDWIIGVDRFFVGDGLANQDSDLATVTEDNGSTARIYIEVGAAANGELKIEFANYQNQYQFVVTAMGFGRLTEDDVITVS